MPNQNLKPSDSISDFPTIYLREEDLQALSVEMLDILLRDHTAGKNIFWAIHDHEPLGSTYDYHSEILPSNTIR